MKKRQLCLICLPVILLFIILELLTGESGEIPRPFEKGETILIQGRIVDQEFRKEKQYLTLHNISILSEPNQETESVSIFQKHGVSICLDTPTELQIGNEILVSGTCSYPQKPSNPGEFDAYSYYYGKDIWLMLNYAKILENDGQISPLHQGAYVIRQYAQRILEQLMPAEEEGILQAILTGDRGNLDQEVRSTFQENGIIHILAISGLHISMIGMALYHFLRKRAISFVSASVVSMGILWAYGFLTGFPHSAVRAILMFCIYLGAQISGRTYDLATSTVAALFLMLLQEPGRIRESGFILSFAAVMGTLFAGQWKSKLLKNTALGNSLAIWICTLPITAYFYYQVPVYGILLNLLVIPPMSAIVGFGVLGLAVGMIQVELGKFLIAPAYYLLKGMVLLASLVRKLPGAVLVTGRPSFVKITLYYVLLLFMVILSNLEKIDLPKRVFGIILNISMFLLRRKTLWVLAVLNVGQGDGICIRTDHHTAIMVDGGSSSKKNLGKYTLEPYLKYYGISEVDTWLISHPDQDHISGLMEILSTYETNLAGKNCGGITIRELVLPSDSDTEEISALAREAGISIRYAQQGDAFAEGNLKVEVLSPIAGVTYQDANEASMVLRIEKGEFSALLTGDLEEGGEKELLNKGILKDCTVLKVGHHGSRNGTSYELLRQVNPQMAVISCGETNRYGHPHQEVLDRLKEAKCEIYRTDQDGIIQITLPS